MILASLTDNLVALGVSIALVIFLIVVLIVPERF